MHDLHDARALLVDQRKQLGAQPVITRSGDIVFATGELRLGQRFVVVLAVGFAGEGLVHGAMLANAMQKSKTPMKKPAAFGCGFFV
jgi:hypothetical protein